jgi:hypothetical protein
MIDPVAEIRRESEVVARLAAEAPLDALVPPCPAWALRDLVVHLGAVQRFWAANIAAADPASPDESSGDPDGLPAPARCRARAVDACEHRRARRTGGIGDDHRERYRRALDPRARQGPGRRSRRHRVGCLLALCRRADHDTLTIEGDPELAATFLGPREHRVTRSVRATARAGSHASRAERTRQSLAKVLHH